MATMATVICTAREWVNKAVLTTSVEAGLHQPPTSWPCPPGPGARSPSIPVQDAVTWQGEGCRGPARGPAEVLRKSYTGPAEVLRVSCRGPAPIL